MRVRDYFGISILVIGLSAALLGHHWFGNLMFWCGLLLTVLAFYVLGSGGREDEIEQAMRDYRGPGDGGNLDYHGGRDASHGGGNDGNSGGSVSD